ncbi:MAG: ABC transporter permease [Asgard group archaeon]|nr:ABC transporter permease [Asgard group archaeon]
MAIGFYFGSAFRNIWNNKKQSFVFLIGITISLTIIFSLSSWSTTASTLAIRDFAKDQDYELRVRSYIPQNLPIIQNWLDDQPIVESTARLYHNLAFFNAENKNPFYRFWPLDDQENNANPVTLTTLFLFPNQSIERISKQFEVEGEFDLGLNDVLISRYHAEQMKYYLNVTVVPGMTVNLTVCRQSVDFGAFLFQYEPINFYNITIRGIYDSLSSITMLQRTFSQDQIQDSIIFLKENMLEGDIDRMEANGLTPILVAKCKADALASEGINGINAKLEQLSDFLLIEHPTSLPFILNTPYDNLLQVYSRASSLLVVLVPVILLGIIQAIFTTNIILENRKIEIEIYQEKGGQKWQIIGSIMLEFTILSVIAIAFSNILSLIVASLIPAIASQELTLSSFADFFMNIEFSYVIASISSVVALIVVSLFVILKVNQILRSDISERDVVFRGKLQKLITLITLSVLTGASIVLFIVFSFLYSRNFSGIYTFTVEHTQRSALLFITLSIAILLITVLLSIGLFALLGRLKALYNKVLRKNSFFLVNYFRNSKYKLNTVMIVLLIMTSSMFFALTLISTMQKSDAEVNYYNNGADLRIITKNVHHSFEDNLTQIEGINETMSVMKTSGKYGSDTFFTIYGIDPIKYSKIGRWIESSFYTVDAPENYNASKYEDWLEILDANGNGTIVSDVLIEFSPSLTYGRIIQVNSIPIEATLGNDFFNITGIIHSAPGLGLSSGINLDLDQPNDYYMIINEEKIYNEYGIVSTNLFFANLDQGANIEQVIADLLELDEVIEVNPDLLSEGFTERYVNKYVPSLRVFLMTQIVFTGIIGLLVIVSNIDYVMNQRKQETAILTALGNTNANYIRMTVSELSIIVVVTIIAGLIIALPLTLLTTAVIVPFLTDILIIPYSFSVNYLVIGVIIVALFILAFLGAIPTLIRTSRQKTAEAIRDETSGAY